MSTNSFPLASCLHADALNALRTESARLHAERQGLSNACPCRPIAQFILGQLPELLHHWLSFPETQCHGSPSATVACEWTPRDDSALSTFNMTTGAVEAPFALDVGSPSLSGSSPMESDFIHQPFLNTPLDPDNGMDAPYLSGPDHLEGCNFNPEPFLEYSDSLLPELNIIPSMDNASSQMWSPNTLLQSPDASSSSSSSNESLFCDYTWMNEHAHNYPVGPSSYDIQPHTQNSSDLYLSSSCGGADLHSPTSSWSEEGKSDCSSLMDDMDGTPNVCRWGGGSCISLLTSDKSEVAKHLHLLHGIKPGGDKDKMSCKWQGCGKEMKKESISRHVVAVHMNNKTECDSCGKQFARLDSKLRHLKKSKREECRESELHDSRAKRRRLSWP
ncbi:hypothetical protein BDR05DRAFT_958341 [Suillus weaverae]|nr:hypothetical protein BDR05DRAFT_958341 [Suillus weaverae]